MEGEGTVAGDDEFHKDMNKTWLALALALGISSIRMSVRPRVWQAADSLKTKPWHRHRQYIVRLINTTRIASCS